MTEETRKSALEKLAQTGYVSPAVFSTGSRAGSEIRSAIKKKIDDNQHTLEMEAAEWPGESDPYYYNILVGGANAAGKGLEGLSALPFGVLAKGKNRVLFRHNQEKEIRAAIQDALKNGKHPRVIGHSWGGARVANIAKDFKDVPFYALDPTSWTGVLDELPANLTIYRPRNNKPDPGASEGTFPGYLAQIFGHQWPKIEKGKGRTVEYNGDHVGGLDLEMTRLNDSERAKREMLAGNKEMADNKEMAGNVQRKRLTPLRSTRTRRTPHGTTGENPTSKKFQEWINLANRRLRKL